MALRPGTIAIVAGGTGGIGSAVSRALSHRKVAVAMLSRKAGSADYAATRRDGDQGAPILGISCDITKPQQVWEAAERVRRELGPPGILIHAAGGRAPGGLLDLTVDEWQAAIEIHLSSAFYLCKAVMPGMVAAREGTVLLISSAAGQRTVPDALAYATAKAALIHFTRCAAREVAPFGVRVNCIAPGFIDTPFHAGSSPEELASTARARIPAGRLGNAAEVSHLMCAILENDYLTGETVVIDGGINLGFSPAERARSAG